MGTLYRYLRDYWKLVALALVLAAINQVFSLLDPLIFRHIIDSYATRYREYSSGEFLRGVSVLLGAALGVENVLEGEDIREAIAGVRAAGMPEGSMPLLAWLAAHSNMPEDVQRELFEDGNPDVLVGLAMNRSLPADLRQALMEHADEDVRHHANHVFFKVKRH